MAARQAHPDLVVYERAGCQHGVVSFGELRRAGLSVAQIKHRIRTGRLVQLHRGVYFAGAGRPGQPALWTAALLTCGERSAITDRSGAQLLGLLPLSMGTLPIDVTVPSSIHRRRGIRVHERPLVDSELTVVDGIRVTTPARTLLDLAATEPRWILERSLREAEAVDPSVAASLAALVKAHRGRRGIRVLRAILGDGMGLARSELELRFRRFLSAHGLDRPRANHRIEVGPRAFEVDFSWPAQRLIVELDGHAFHRGRQAFESDRDRDRVLQAAGWRVVRITWRQLHDEPTLIARDLRQLLGESAPRAKWWP